MKNNRIGIFGGTFNPIHTGHLKAAEDVQKKFKLKKVLFIPSYIPPHKETSDVASPQHRLQMVELATSLYPQFVPSALEIEAKGKSYSIFTLRKVKELYPKALIFFILGIDAFLEIDTWKDYQKVLEQCFFIVISRPGYRLEEGMEILGGRYKSRMYEASELGPIEEEVFSSFRIFLFDINSLEVSSSEIRSRIKEGRSIKGMVPEAVETYIYRHQLYRNSHEYE
ncbi:MAG: nicotinate-nucleotide adenylyltransferase [Candidatus Aminicenantales bacterium]